MTQEYVGATAGFVATSVIYDPLWDVEGFIGYLPSDESIFVVFEGTQSQRQSDMDIDTNPAKYDTWPECNCRVHAGFNRGVNRVWDDVLKEVTRLQAMNPTYKVKVTGHSLGAALAQLAGMRLV